MTGETILITGANGGIGQYVARYLLSHGERNIVLHYRSANDKVLHLLMSLALLAKDYVVARSLVGGNGARPA